MKTVIGISLGSQRQDFDFQTTLMGQPLRVRRLGTNGSLDRAAALLKYWNSRADAIGLGLVKDSDQIGNGHGTRDDQRFAQLAPLATRAPLADGHRLFLEVHPTQVLQRPIQEACREAQAIGGVYPSLQREADGAAMLLTSLGSMYANGSRVRWEAVYTPRGRNVPLPRTAWQRRRYWLPGAPGGSGREPVPAGGTLHPLLGQIVHSAVKPETFIAQTVLAANLPQYLGDHRVYAAAVFPAAAYAEFALAVAQQMPGQGRWAIENFKFEKTLLLPDSGSVLVQIGASRRRETIELEYYSRADAESAAADAAWTRHASGTLRLLEVQAAPETQLVEPADFIATADEQIAGDAHYDLMRAHGLRYGHCFRGIASLWRRDRQVLAQLALPQAVAAELSSYHIHPAVLDLAFQSVAACLVVPQATHKHETLLPVALQSLQVFGQAQRAAYAYAVLREPLPGAPQRQIAADVFLLDSAGSTLVAARGLVLQRLDRTVSGENSATARLLYEIAWRPQPLAAVTDDTAKAPPSGAGLTSVNPDRDRGP
jgi:acyl transferase domain-containing protein